MRKAISIIIVALFLMSMFLTFLPLATRAQQVPNGPPVDEVIFFKEEDYAKAVAMLKTGDMDIYLSDIADPVTFNEQIKPDPNLDYSMAFGLYYELTFNPVGPLFDNGKFNPFHDPAIREAMNWLVDREYIKNEIMGGLAVEKFTILHKAFPEYARLADTELLIEKEYSYNYEQAKSAIFERMFELGATFEDGKWYYNGEPVVIKFIIRTEDFRLDIGNYVSDQLESLGFTVDRMYKTSREASPLWLFGDPHTGDWSLYTGGWITTVIPRDQADEFAFFYTPAGLPLPLWQAYEPDPLFYELATNLAYGKWKTWDERMGLMRKGLWLSMKDSVRVWLVDQTAPFVYRSGIKVAVDLSGGLSNDIWGRTLVKGDTFGGSVKAGNREVLVDPWNPIAGSDWVYDAIIYGQVTDSAGLYNPYTGLYTPNNFETAEVVVPSGSPVIKSSDWLTLTFSDEPITVPSDAFWGYDPVSDTIENPPAGTEASVKVTINFGDVLGKVKYHDGSVMTLADFYMPYLIAFSRGNNQSPIYDEAYVPDFEQWRSIFKGFRVVSESPFVVEYYYDYLALEAETIVAAVIDWPTFPFEVYAIGVLAEMNQQAAFSADKADKLGVEWMNYIGGPSLSILADSLSEAKAENFIPFSGVLSQYLSASEAAQRYSNLDAWYNDKGHFYVANGPFYLDMVDFTAHQAVIKANREYQHPADQWLFLSSPPVPEPALTIPESVVPGLESSIIIDVQLAGQPYPPEKIDFVKYLIADSEGNILFSGDATSLGGSKYEIALNATQTGTLSPGLYKLTVIVASTEVGTPAIVEDSFVVIPQISYFQGLLAKVQAQITAKLSSLEGSLSSLSGKVDDLESTVAGIPTVSPETIANLSNLTYASLAIAVISLIIALAAVLFARKG